MVATPEFAAPSVPVVHPDDPDIKSGAKFKAGGMQVAAGVPIAAPSGNTSGRPSPTTAGHMMEDMLGKIEGIVDSETMFAFRSYDKREGGRAIDVD